MEKNFEEEKKYLKETLEKFQEIIENTELRIDALPRMYRDNPLMLSDLMRQFTSRLKLLKKTEKKPYFARIDFKNKIDDITEECYIGKVGVSDDDNNLVTVDWRAPIASLYYDSNVGKASYEAPEGIIDGDLLLKRQYDIEDKELIGYQDVDTVSNDEMLKPYLNASADNRLKNIVSTIQSEQNEIIREKLFNNMIIQGVAGSGKTTVALHRIAYLVYNNLNNIKPEQYLVIGPNKFFVNYISGVLPDLDVDNVSQLTYDEIIKELIGEDLVLVSDEPKLKKSIKDINQLFFERLRVSMAYKKALDSFLIDFDKTIVPKEDFIVKGYNLIPQKIILNAFNNIDMNGVVNYEILQKKVDRAILLMNKYIEDNYENILSNARNQFYEKINNKGQKEVEKERKNLLYIEKELRNKCNQSLKKYFIKSKPNILTLYINYLKNIDLYINIDEYDLNKLSKDTIVNIKNKKIEFEDLGALLYLYYRIYGSANYEKYRHAVIDEAQDFGEFNFYALKKLMPKCTFSIFGDIAQSIYQYRGIQDWEKVIDTTFEGKCDLKYLKKSYRTTTEIMNSANNVTNYIGLHTAEPVIRHGVGVNYIQTDNNLKDTLIYTIGKYINNNYSSIAIISKDENEANEINLILKENGIDATNITSSDKEYNGGICTITSYLAKGLEFDGVIITDASEEKYNSNKSIDMKLLYVSMTRPLHELTILHEGEISKPLTIDSKKKIKLK